MDGAVVLEGQRAANAGREKRERETEKGEKEKVSGGAGIENEAIRKRVKSEIQKEMRVFLSLFSLNIYVML